MSHCPRGPCILVIDVELPALQVSSVYSPALIPSELFGGLHGRLPLASLYPLLWAPAQYHKVIILYQDFELSA